MDKKNGNAQLKRLHNVEASLDGAPLPELMEITGLGVEAVYGKPSGTDRLGGFHVFRPTNVTLRFRLTDCGTLRKICGSRAEMITTRTMVVRWLDPEGKPTCTVNLTGVFFLRYQQNKTVLDDPYEEVEISAETLTYS